MDCSLWGKELPSLRVSVDLLEEVFDIRISDEEIAPDVIGTFEGMRSLVHRKLDRAACVESAE